MPTLVIDYFIYVHSGKSGIIHFGGSVSFFLRASSAISSILSNEVLLMKFDAATAFSLLGHLSPKMQPFTQASAQFTVTSIVTFPFSNSQDG